MERLPRLVAFCINLTLVSQRFNFYAPSRF